MVANLRRLHAVDAAACCSWPPASATASTSGRCRSSTSARWPRPARRCTPALQRHMVVPLNESYKFAGLDGLDDGASDADAVNPTYRFQHDRVQQAAYALIDDDRKQAVHLSIGRLIRRHASAQERRRAADRHRRPPERGPNADRGSAERAELARMNLEAGHQGAAVVGLRLGARLPRDRPGAAARTTAGSATAS